MPTTRSRRNPLILIHGGAGSRRPTSAQLECLLETLRQSYGLLHKGQRALPVVEQAIRALEASGLFNAGLGSFQQLDGIQRMDAAIMEGKALAAGAVASLEGFLHPITAARLVMTQTDHVLIVGPHAKRLVRHFGLQRLPRAKSAKKPSSRSLRKKSIQTPALYKKMGWYDTVGAVVLDHLGTLAAGASTGGVSVMLPGRVGDTPLIGSGVYADNSAAGVSMTGIGESIIRLGMAKWLATMVQNGYSPQRAAQKALRELVQRVKGKAGCLLVTSKGEFTIQHCTPWMAAGYCDGQGEPFVRDHFSKPIAGTSQKN